MHVFLVVLLLLLAQTFSFQSLILRDLLVLILSYYTL